MRYPNLFILGAPKCGTTTLHDWLSQHPQVDAPRPKEPHHFYSPYGQAIDRNTYLSAYSDEACSVSVDASVWYLFSQTAVPCILKLVPDPRFVVCLRSPLQMAPSLHYQKLFTGHETVRSFEAAWRLDPVRRAGRFEGIRDLPPAADPRHMAYCYACELGRQVEQLLGVVNRSDVHFYFLDDMMANPKETFADVCEFLRLEPNVEIDFRISNQAKRLHSPLLRRILDAMALPKKALGIQRPTGILRWVHRANQHKQRYAPVPVSLMAEMREAFRDDVALLSRMTGRNLSHWLE